MKQTVMHERALPEWLALGTEDEAAACDVGIHTGVTAESWLCHNLSLTSHNACGKAAEDHVSIRSLAPTWEM